MKQGRKIADGAEAYLEPGERLLVALVAQARGATTARVGGNLIANELGARKAGRNADAAGEAGLVVRSPMGLVLTDRRLLTLAISTPWGLGLGGTVKELLSAVPVEDVESIEVKRLAAGRRITLTVRGTEFKLEAGAGADADGLAESLAQLRPEVAIPGA